jgi:RNA polymerase sigma factor FliA
MTTQPVPQAMWQEYATSKSPELRRELAVHYLNLVRYVVARHGAASASAPRMLETRDLVQVGVIGLLDAIERFDPARGVKFETYAVTRIRGTIQDELRKLDWVPRSVRKKARAAENGGEESARSSLPTDGHRKTTQYSEEVLGVMMNATTDESRAVDNLATDESSDLLEIVGSDQLKAILTRTVEELPEDERLIVTLYYYEELTFREIGDIVHLSESRVFQKHAAVMKKLRARFGDTHV